MCSGENKRVYYKWAFPILFFEILVPLVILYRLYKEFRNDKECIHYKTITKFTKNYGYFFFDYKRECYFWEFIRISQRILMIGILIILSDYEILKAVMILSIV